MKATETRVTFIYDKDIWKIIQLIASKLMCAKENGKIAPCTGSDIIRELLDVWLIDHAVEWYPKLLEEFKAHNIQSRARKIIEEDLKRYKEDLEAEKLEGEKG